MKNAYRLAYNYTCRLCLIAASCAYFFAGGVGPGGFFYCCPAIQIHAPQGSSSGICGAAMTQTPQPWWSYPRIDNLGQPDLDGGFPKPDSNIAVPDGTPLTAPASGEITYIDTTSSFGQAITVAFDTPPNPQVTSYVFLHLTSIPGNLAVGQHVNVGDTLGVAGTNPQNAATGFALYPGLAYGVDPHWTSFDTVANLTANGPYNPVPYLDALLNGTNPNNAYPTVTGSNAITQIQEQLGAIGSTLGALGPWITNPTRLLKLGVGLLLLGGALFIVAQPESGLALLAQKGLGNYA